MVVEQTARGERSFDIFSRLLKEDIVFVGTPIDGIVANLALCINSPGGMTTSGLAILDTMNLVQPDIVTYCVDQAAYSRVLIHQPHASGLRRPPGSRCRKSSVTGNATTSWIPGRRSHTA